MLYANTKEFKIPVFFSFKTSILFHIKKKPLCQQQKKWELFLRNAWAAEYVESKRNNFLCPIQ